MWTLSWPSGRIVDPVHLHDVFNLVTIAVLNILNIYYLATGSGFLIFYTASMVYFLLDIIYVGCYPHSVKSPLVILGHHIVTAVYMLIPYTYPQYHWCMAYCMLVEVNTWLLIAKRTVKLRVLGVNILEIGFYISWVLLRNIWYPYLIYAFYKEWLVESEKCGSRWNPILICPVCQTLLTGLNFHWTTALLIKMATKQKTTKIKAA